MAQENARLVAELSRFRQFAARKRLGTCAVEVRADDVIVLKPVTDTPKAPGQSADGDAAFPGKDIGLTLLGLVHGNETAGLAILNELLSLIEWQLISPSFPIAFALGNVPAALDGKRFLERDLNRSFAETTGSASKESLRARVLEEALLSHTAYLVDFHQTLQASDRAFFIFPYSEGGYRFARDIRPSQTLVTHWGDVFSKDGFCTDEFVNRAGGVGITVELGKNGFDPYQIDSGVLIAQWAMRVVAGYAGSLEPVIDQPFLKTSTGPLLTWASEVPWPATDEYVELAAGFHNFARVEQGQHLGLYGKTPIVSPADGFVLFAKYLSREQQATLPARPAELMRLAREITEADLP